MIRVRGDAVQSRARQSGTSQTLSVGDGLTRKPISDCIVCCDCKRGVWAPSSLLFCCVAARWLLLRSMNVSCCVACSQILSVCPKLHLSRIVVHIVNKIANSFTVLLRFLHGYFRILGCTLAAARPFSNTHEPTMINPMLQSQRSTTPYLPPNLQIWMISTKHTSSATSSSNQAVKSQMLPRARRASKACYNKVYYGSEETVQSSQLCKALYMG